MDNKEEVKEKLLAMYKDALEDASSYYKSDYSCSSTDDKNRDKEDEEDIQEFKKFLELL